MRALTEAAAPLTSREIAGAVGLNDSTTHRLLQTLKEEGYVCRDEGKRYYASPSALMPLSLYHPLNVLRRAVADVLRSLRDQFGMTSSLVVFVGTERLVLDISAAFDISPYYNTHLTSPLHASATGKILLMGLAPGQQRELLGPPPLPAYTPSTIVDFDALMRELDLTRKRGVATNLDENFAGLSAASAPIAIGRAQPVACLTVAGPSERFKNENFGELCRALLEKSRLIAVGFPGLRAVDTMFARYG